MKIYCTVKQFGQLVRACEKGTCYTCVLRAACKADPENPKTIEDFITAETIEKEAKENGEIHHDRNGIQSNHEVLLPCFEQG